MTRLPPVEYARIIFSHYKLNMHPGDAHFPVAKLINSLYSLPVEQIRPTATETPETPAAGLSAKTWGRVTPRAIIFALILTVLNDYWLVQIEVVRYSFATYAAPFYNVIFTILVITALNVLLRRIRPRLAFTRVELVTVYVMLSVSSAVCSHNMMQILVSLMGYAHWFKTPTNQWGPLFADRLPRWLTVSDQESLRNFYRGNSSLYLPENYGPWVVPVICWSAFAAALLFTMLCLNSILRKQWVESERLTFPIVTLPLEMTQEDGAFFRNRHMWLGFAIAGGLTLLAGLNFLFPAIPYLRITRINVGGVFTTPPWNAMGGIIVAFYFWAIGIAFLMPLELSISCWLFYWLMKMELVFCAATGINQLTVPAGGFDSRYPFLLSQSYGAYLGFFVISLWSSRHYLARVWRTAFKGTKEEDESREALSYRAAILGAAFGFMFLATFAVIMGMSPLVVVVFFVFYFVFAVLVSRIRAELGFPTHDMHVMAPQHLIQTVAGSEHIGRADATGFSLFFWFNRTYASHPSSHMMEGYKLAEQSSGPARQIFIATVIASVLALPIGFWMLLHMYFHNGAATANVEIWALGFGREAWTQLENLIRKPMGPNPTAMGFVGVGFLISIALGWARLRFLSFPLHPLAYAIAPSWGMSQLWLPLFIGSMAKVAILKFGGLKSYRIALPFFLGLILGEITVGSLWTLLGIIGGFSTYDFWPGQMPR